MTRSASRDAERVAAWVAGGPDGSDNEARDVPVEIRAAVFARAGDACERCGLTAEQVLARELYDVGPLKNPDNQQPPLTVHHIARRIDGGTNDADNLLVLCVPCHREWHALGWRYMTHERWMRTKPYRDLILVVDALEVSR